MNKISECSILLSCTDKLFLFKGIETDEISSLLKPFCEKGVFAAEYDHKEVIFEPNNFQRNIGFILKGAVTVFGANGEEHVLLNTIPKGGVFGVAALFSKDAAYTSTLIAKGKSTVLFFSQECVKSLIHQNPIIAENYIEFLSEKIRFLNGKISTFTTVSTEDRLYKYLCSQAPGGACEFTLPISINHLSNWLNVGRASLYRSFDSLEQKGLIKKDGRNINLLKIL